MKIIYTLIAAFLLMPRFICAENITKLQNLESNETDSIFVKKVNTVSNFIEKHKNIISKLPKVKGYMRIGYTYGEDISNFNIANVRIDLNGSFSSKFDYRFYFDFVNTRVLDARIRWKPMKELNLCVGQFKTPFTLNNMLSHLQESCISFPLVISKLTGMSDVCGLKSSGRDIGVSIYGNLFRLKNGIDLIEYSVGIFNGNGYNIADDNKSKDVAARIIIHPLKGLQLSSSIYYGEYGKDYTKRNRVSFGGAYNSDYGAIRAEYINGTTGTVKSDGYYILASYNIVKKFAPLFRFDSFTEDKSTKLSQYNYTAGVDYRPFKFLRLQANYVRETFTATESNNLYQFMITGIF